MPCIDGIHLRSRIDKRQCETMENSESPETKVLHLKWTKSELVTFASCLETKPQDKTQGESGAQKCDFEETDRYSEMNSVRINNTDLEDDDVFIWDEQRRASEPVVLKRNGNALMVRPGRHRSSKLRSLDECVPVAVNRIQTSKLTRSVSSSDAQSAISQFFTFSPRIVRKINLSSSLQDWLENDRQSRRLAGENLVTSESYLAENSMESYLQRRRSADTVGEKMETDGEQRPSAPPVLTGKKNGKCKENCAQATTRGLSSDSIHGFQIYTLIKEELKSKLECAHFCATSCRKWCEEISEVIKERIQELLDTPCKVVSTIYIGALRDHGIHAASQASLDCKLDYHVSACYQNESIFAAASVLVVRYAGR